MPTHRHMMHQTSLSKSIESLFFLSQLSLAEEIKTGNSDTEDEEMLQKRETKKEIEINQPKADIKSSEVIKVDQGKAFPRDI